MGKPTVKNNLEERYLNQLKNTKILRNKYNDLYRKYTDSKEEVNEFRAFKQ